MPASHFQKLASWLDGWMNGKKYWREDGWKGGRNGGKEGKKCTWVRLY